MRLLIELGACLASFIAGAAWMWSRYNEVHIERRADNGAADLQGVSERLGAARRANERGMGHVS